eukprot:CAMPEP_0168778496 /NCGR_PEP_ID=MMETSP0725-20121227/7114_1 /TAXON_ID=265536 /ORGANISM="Amphiprora sp., Strain CCMP467" /LENGTH=187 /DNA_ID=CAMNT_0008828271 /DNA_START=67 /DNA_END=630 /DNA_ORIENTATION=+
MTTATAKPPPPSSSSSSRRVQFSAEVDVQSVDETTTSDSARTDLFYSRQDIRNFRSSFQEAAKSLECDDNTAAKMVARLHQACRRNSFDSLDDEVFGEIFSKQDDDDEQVVLVGLEHVASDEIRNEKTMQLEEMMDRIQEIQDCVYNNNSKDDNDKKAEEIRAACERISKPSRRFAARLAKVSATAA